AGRPLRSRPCPSTTLFRCWRVGAEESGAEKNGFGAATGGVNLLCHPRARARGFSKFSGPARCGSTGSGRLGGAAAAGGGRDALSYGVSFATTRSHQLARGALTCFFTLVRARVVFLYSQGRRDAARPDRAAWGCSGCWRRPRRSQLRGQLRHDPIAPAGQGGSGVLSLRHFGLVLFIPWRVGAEESGAAKNGLRAQHLNNALTECLKREIGRASCRERVCMTFCAASATRRAGEMLVQAIGPPGRCSSWGWRAGRG